LLAVDNDLAALSMTGSSHESGDADNGDWPADIVVVDDEPDAGAVMREILQQTGATVRLASSAVEALAMIRQSRPDLLISDIGMPQIDGYQLLRMLRSEEEPGQPPLPAIALTAFARPEDKRRAIEAGYLIHLAKPVESADLITAAKLTVRRPLRSIGIKPD
jgi:CheY-like chemotaxis protein